MEFEGYRQSQCQTPVFMEMWAASAFHALKVDLTKQCILFKLAVGSFGNSGWFIILPGTFHCRQQSQPLKDSSCTLNAYSKLETRVELDHELPLDHGMHLSLDLLQSGTPSQSPHSAASQHPMYFVFRLNEDDPVWLIILFTHHVCLPNANTT